jgi:TonB family protein
MPEKVSCGDFEALAVLYAAGELEVSVRAAVEYHARECPGCAAALRREMQLGEILAAHTRALAEPQPSDQLLARCRRDLSKALANEAGARRSARRGWWHPRNWAAVFRVSPDFHPAWSVAALLLVGILAGLAGWTGVGRGPVLAAGQPVMTISAAPPPPVAPSSGGAVAAAPAARSPQAPVQEMPPAPAGNQAAVEEAAGNAPVYPATDASTNQGLLALEALTASEVEATAAPRLPPQFSEEAMPRFRRNTPPQLPAAVPAPGEDARSRGRLANLSRRIEREISRRMDTLWWGGVRVDPADQQQRLLRAPSPEYPEVARRAGIEGQVTLLLWIAEDGSVQESRLLSGEPVLGRAAMRAVEQWRYAPPRIGGRPVSVVSSVTLSFELR